MISDILNNAGNGIVKAIQSNIRAADKNASGKTSQSLAWTIEETGSNFTLEVSAVKHFPVLEKGRKAGKMPPVNKIKEWTKARGLPDGLAWGISKAIAKNGTKLFQQGGREDIYSNVITDQRINDILKEIADAFSDEAFNDLKQEIN